MMKNRILGLAVVMAVMLSLFMASSAMAADPVSKSGSPYIPVELDVDINDQPYTVFAVTDVATDPDGDETITLAGADYPCGYEDGTHFNVAIDPWDAVGDQKTCDVLVTDGTGYASVMINITIVAGPPDDTEAPIVTITSPADGTVFTTNTTTLTYGVTDNMDPSPTCIQKIGGVPFTGPTVTLAEGLNTITVECTDAANKTGGNSVDVTYTPPPAGDPVTINLENVTIREQDSNVAVYVPVRLSSPSPVDITLSYKTESKKAEGGVDYVEVTDGSLVIEAGATYGEIVIIILGDDDRESSENFFVIGDIAIESGPYATLLKDQATVVIQNDDR